MWIKLSRFSRQQYVMVTISAANLIVAQYRRNFSRWVCLRSAEVPLSEIDQGFAGIQSQLKQLTASWEIPNGTYVSWVLPSDIVGAFNFCKQNDVATEISNLSPFSLSDLKLSDLKKNNETQQTIYWIHKDWINEIARISKELNWICVEFFSRAQLFIKVFPIQTPGYKLLLEGRDSDVFFHIYTSAGALLRTTKAKANLSDGMVAFIKKEIKSLPARTADDLRLFVFNTNPELAQSLEKDFKVVQLPSSASTALMSQLLFSAEEGVELSPVYDALVRRVNVFSLILVISASIMFGIAVWCDEVTQSDIDRYRSQLRKEATRFQAGKYLLADALKMADAVKEKDSIVVEPSSFKLLAEVLPMLPIPASLSYFDQNGRTLKIAGVQSGSDAIKLNMEKNSVFHGAKVAAVPEELKANKQVFSLEFLWRDPMQKADGVAVDRAMK